MLAFSRNCHHILVQAFKFVFTLTVNTIRRRLEQYFAGLSFTSHLHLSCISIISSLFNLIYQVATVIVYAYFLMNLFGWQYLDPNQHYRSISVDLYVPVFGALRFLFYMGWLKVSYCVTLRRGVHFCRMMTVLIYRIKFCWHTIVTLHCHLGK